MDSTPARPLLGLLLAHHQLHLQLKVIGSYIMVEQTILVKSHNFINEIMSWLESLINLHFHVAATVTQRGGVTLMWLRMYICPFKWYIGGLLRPSNTLKISSWRAHIQYNLRTEDTLGPRPLSSLQLVLFMLGFIVKLFVLVRKVSDVWEWLNCMHVAVCTL